MLIYPYIQQSASLRHPREEVDGGTKSTHPEEDERNRRRRGETWGQMRLEASELKLPKADSFRNTSESPGEEMKEADGGEDSSLSSSLWSLGRKQKAIMAGRGFSLIKST